MTSVILTVVSATMSNETVAVDDETTIADTRAVVSAMAGLAPEKVKLNFRGSNLMDDEATWAAFNPKHGEKLYVALDTSALGRQAMNTHGSVDSIRQYREGRHPQQQQQQRQAALGEMNMPPGMADALSNAVTPAMIDGMFQSIPELRNLQRENPQLAAELRDPENFRNMMRAQMDSLSRRTQQNTQTAQMAHLSNTEGGWQMAERMVHSLQRDDHRGSAVDDAPAPGGNMPAPGVVRGRDGQPAVTPLKQSTTERRETSGATAEISPGFHSSNASQGASAYPYERQLKLLTLDMGFEEDVARLALDEANGDVDGAVNIIAQWADA